MAIPASKLERRPVHLSFDVGVHEFLEHQESNCIFVADRAGHVYRSPAFVSNHVEVNRDVMGCDKALSAVNMRLILTVLGRLLVKELGLFYLILVDQPCNFKLLTLLLDQVNHLIDQCFLEVREVHLRVDSRRGLDLLLLHPSECGQRGWGLVQSRLVVYR